MHQVSNERFLNTYTKETRLQYFSLGIKLSKALQKGTKDHYALSLKVTKQAHYRQVRQKYIFGLGQFNKLVRPQLFLCIYWLNQDAFSSKL